MGVTKRPVYNVLRCSTPQSRASHGRITPSSSQRYSAKKYSDRYGYKILDAFERENDVGNESGVSKLESRADVASMLDYCKFSSGKSESGLSLDLERTGDG